MGVISSDEDVLELWEGCKRFILGKYPFGGLNAFLLVFHVALLCFLRLWKMFMVIFDIDEGPCAVVSFENG